MFAKIKSDYISWILLIGMVVLFLEFVFFNRGLIFSLLVQGGMVYLGRKWMPRTMGKILFWGGLIFLAISIFSMITVRFFLLAILIHFLVQFAGSKKNPQQVKPIIKEATSILVEEELIKRKPLFSNQFFGQQRSSESVFEWNDINIQTGIGDTVIDLSYTVLPKGESVIFVRNFVGNIQILVPYDLEVSVNHSAVAGSNQIFELRERNVFNQALHMQTPGFEEAEQRVKIVTSLFVGDLEVKRV